MYVNVFVATKESQKKLYVSKNVTILTINECMISILTSHTSFYVHLTV